MPAYNAAAFLAEAIESILQQTLRDFELIIVDDGSTDATLNIIESYAKSDPRIRVIHNPHGGVSSALNAGLHAARYDWVAVMHSDDVALPQRLQRQWEATKTDPSVVIWGTDGYHLSANGERIGHFRVGPTTVAECEALRKAGETVQAIHPTVLLKRDVALQAGGYDSNFDGSEDIEIFDRILKYGPLVTITEPLLNYRIHNSSLSMKKHHSQKENARYIQARQRQRMATGHELTIEEYRASYAHQPLLVRIIDQRNSLVSLYYRRAGNAYGMRQAPQGLYFLTIAALLNPSYVIRRAWKQVIAPKLRRADSQPQAFTGTGDI